MNIRKKHLQGQAVQPACLSHSGHRLRVALKACEIPPTAFAEWLRTTSPQRLNNWFLRGLPDVHLEGLARALSLSRFWLETGEGEP